MALSYNLAYQESISVHPTRRQNFAGKPYSNFPDIWQWVYLRFSSSGYAAIAEGCWSFSAATTNSSFSRRPRFSSWKKEINEKMWRFFWYIFSSPEIVNYWEMTNEKTWRWILCCISPCAKMEDTLHIRWKKQPWIWLLHCNKVSSLFFQIFNLNNVKQKFSRYLTPTL